jgi:flagellar hook protein FlgE
MSLNASMWTGVSGLRGHGQQMGVIGNNIANVSTVGFKGSRMHFEDFMSQSVSVAGGTGQVGRGVSVGAILGDFSQGSMETTNEATDVAIQGNGFFQVSPAGQEIVYYTRAGNFRFDNEGFLVDPHGYRVQGWAMEEGESKGNPIDIELEDFQSPPEATSEINMIFNLDSETESNTGADPLWEQWEGLQDPPVDPIDQESYAYQSTLKVYDQNGGSHDLSIYFDPRREDDGGELVDPNDPNQTWDFMVTVPPEEDARHDGGAPIDDAEKGLIQRGQLVFNAAGDLTNMIFYDEAGAAINTEDMEFEGGNPLVELNFLGDGEEFQTQLDFGLSFNGLADGDPPDPADWTKDAMASTSYSSASTTLSQSQDGYTSGFLQNVSFGRDGVMTGRFSNGQVQEMYQLSLADFNNVWGLRREGGNLFAETRDSGDAVTGKAGVGRFGTVSGNSLELSNVDLATEFVKMISSQKGFQANSKTITTTDTMLDEVIRMKR